MPGSRSTQSIQELQHGNASGNGNGNSNVNGKGRNGEREPLLSAGTAEAIGGDARGYGAVRINVEPSRGQQPQATLSVSKRDGGSRWCEICEINKPDRCHHCSQCETCVLRMDHHCPWIGGCVGYNNHKFFYLFIVYTTLVALWVSVTMAPLLAKIIHQCGWRKLWGQISQDGEHPTQCVSDKHWIIMSGFAFALTLILGSFTWAHTLYIIRNQTTIELLQRVRTTFLRVQYTNPNHGPLSSSSVPLLRSAPGFHVVKAAPGVALWDRGSCMENWKSIMGPSWWLWWCKDTIAMLHVEEDYVHVTASAQ